MAYDQSLAVRVRKALADRVDVVEKPMFGGLTFMVAGKMCCGIIGGELMIRLAPDTTLAQLKSPHARICDFTRRPMRAFFVIDAKGCDDQRSVGRWVRLAIEHSALLPRRRSVGTRG